MPRADNGIRLSSKVQLHIELAFRDQGHFLLILPRFLIFLLSRLTIPAQIQPEHFCRKNRLVLPWQLGLSFRFGQRHLLVIPRLDCY